MSCVVEFLFFFMCHLALIRMCASIVGAITLKLKNTESRNRYLSKRNKNSACN